MNELLQTMLLATCLTALACDECEPPPQGSGNQDSESLAVCPPLPQGVEPIEGLAVAHAWDRFGGLAITLSSRPLACGEPAAQHDYCSANEHGLTVGLPEEQAVVGTHDFGTPVFVEFETPDTLSVGGGGPISSASVEIFEITDSCVTGRIIGLQSEGGPFDGGFRAPRCTP